jgi:sortase A
MTARVKDVRFKPLRLFEVAAWVAGIGLLGTYGGARWWYAHSHETALASFHTAQSAAQITRISEPEPEAAVDMSTWSTERKERYRETLRDDLTPEALLRIPALKLVVPVFDGANETNLNRGAGRIEGTARIGEEGNLGIAAHRDGFFRVLKDVHLGDVLLIERLTVTEQYRVESIDIVDPSQVSVLDPTSTRSVTLVTCFPFYHLGPAPKRFIVRAAIVAEDRERDAAPALADSSN